MSQTRSLIDELSEKLRPLNNLVDELQGIGLETYIKLPSIAVVGEQSSGKSSVLESIVGENFLPKSDELATRLPIRLHLVRKPNCPDNFQTYACIKGVRNANSQEVHIECTMDQLTQKLNDVTNKIAGTNYNIVATPIDVGIFTKQMRKTKFFDIADIYGKDVPNLTLVDLPGIARVPRPNSDMPKNIEEVTKGLVRKFIQEPETVILAVAAANMDLASSTALQMAKEADESCSRTIGVLTKIDIMDLGTNAKKMLQGEYHTLKLGYVGVKNRSKADIDNGVTVKAGLEAEKISND